MRRFGQGTGWRDPRGRHDRGAVVVVFALILVALLTMAAIVVDLGQARAARRDAQTIADLSATAAGWVLAGNGQESVVVDPAAACRAAVDSVTTNVSDFPTAAAAAIRGQCSTLPGADGSCPASPTTLTSTASEPYLLSIVYPVPATDIERDEFATGGTTLDGDPCERMKVTAEKFLPSVFGGVVGSDGRTLGGTAVARATIDDEGESVPALLMLEREACQVLQVSGQGAISVRASNGQPGIIHSDSSAQVPPCTNNTNAGGYNIFGTAMPSSGLPSIRADGVNATPGRIQMFSLSPGVNGRGGHRYQASCVWINETNNSGCNGSGLSAPPIGARIVSRRPVDLRYGANITSLYAEGRARVGVSPGAAASAGYTVVGGGDCNANNRVYGTATSTIYVNCNEFSGANVVFNGREVIFNGKVSIQNGYQAFPNAEEIYIRGCTSGANCAAIDVRSNGIFSVNSGTTQAVPPLTWSTPACLTERPPGDPSQNWTQLATFGGALTVGQATLQLCQTAALLSYDTGAAYQRITRTTGGNCASNRPCPANALPAGVVDQKPLVTSANSQAILWSGPNRGSADPTDYSGDSPFEDLALWTEAIGVTSSTQCSLGGQADLRTAGVFFHPNCQFQYAGQTSNVVPFNAQFIGRSLDISGQGILSMQPNQRDAVRIPLAGRVYLIR